MPFSLSRCTRFAFSLHQQLIMSVCETWNHQYTSPHSWPAMNSRLMCWSSLSCFRTANHASLGLHLLLCVWMCLFWPVALVCSPVSLSLCAALILCLLLVMAPTKLQSMGQHWSAPVRGLPAMGQPGLPWQHLQLHTGWAGQWRGTCRTRVKPAASS